MSNARRDEERDTMTTLTTEYRARLRDLAAKATPGPWEYYTPNPRHALGVDAVFSVPLDCDPLARDSGIAEGMAPRDSKFIAAADPATVTALLDDLDEAEAALRSIPGYTTPEHLRDALVALFREKNAAEAARDTAERQVKAVRAIVAEHRAARRDKVSRLSFEGEELLLTSLSRALGAEAGR